MKCGKCGSKYMQKRPSAPDTDWECVGCGSLVFRESNTDDTDNGMRMLAEFLLFSLLVLFIILGVLFCGLS